MRCSLKNRVNPMSDPTRTTEEYIQRYANDYCNGDVEEAKKHAIVQAVIQEKEKGGDR